MHALFCTPPLEDRFDISLRSSYSENDRTAQFSYYVQKLYSEKGDMVSLKIRQYSKTGNYHERCSAVNQDVMDVFETDEFVALFLSDGATGCKESLTGAKIACASGKALIQKKGMELFSYPKEKISYLITEYIRENIEKARSFPMQEYGATFLMVTIEKTTGKGHVVSLGDGAVFQIENEKTKQIQRPIRMYGKPCLTIAKDAHTMVEVSEFQYTGNSCVILSSDGFWQEVTNQKMWNLLEKRNFSALNQQLDKSIIQDDCSYIALDGSF